TFDACGSHSTVEGRYHHHGTPGCFLEEVGARSGFWTPRSCYASSMRATTMSIVMSMTERRPMKGRRCCT
ncbi:unnamed protein product, partial [Pylaiella littoralis]